MPESKLKTALSDNIEDHLFPPGRELVPNIGDVYELQLAFYENLLLSDAELLRNGAYFARVGKKFTRHFLMCAGEALKLPDHSSSRLKSFFGENIFRTGYATHGLFPYRGKFHPQMIKGLINAMELKPGQKVLDPMMGSGTVPVEAALMGMDSFGLDASPFCRFMAQTKVDALTMPLKRAKGALEKVEDVFNYFQKQVGKPVPGSKTKGQKTPRGYMEVMEPAAEYVTNGDLDDLSKTDRETANTYAFLLLAYLDSAGYSERSDRKSPIDQFRAILERYVFVAEKIQAVLSGTESDLGVAKILEGDARDLPFEDDSIDGIIFSPPYSFAIDYLENDSFHLNFLGVDANELREKMVGLRGRTLANKFELYLEDMRKILSECARVLRKDAVCTIIVGTNNNQLSKVLGISPDRVTGLHQLLAQSASSCGMRQIKMLSRPITGMSNTMRREYIVLLQKTV
jgi:SAM-dependent methyltransferase